MNVEQKLAFRQLLSDILMYMSEAGRTKSEILTVQDRLEKDIEKMIDADLQRGYSFAQHYKMPDVTRIKWRTKIAGVLYMIAQPECTPAKIITQIHDLEAFAEGMLDAALRAAIGKPKMFIKKYN
jgi:hypothetical protein